MTFDQIRDALAAHAADLTDAQKDELRVLLGGHGGTVQPQSGDNGPKPPVPPVKQP